jgi:hypothetical protein
MSNLNELTITCTENIELRNNAKTSFIILLILRMAYTLVGCQNQNLTAMHFIIVFMHWLFEVTTWKIASIMVRQLNGKPPRQGVDLSMREGGYKEIQVKPDMFGFG